MSANEGTPWDPPEIEIPRDTSRSTGGLHLHKALEQLDLMEKQLQDIEAEMDAILASAPIGSR
jgi:hypothetical protein